MWFSPFFPPLRLSYIPYMSFSRSTYGRQYSLLRRSSYGNIHFWEKNKTTTKKCNLNNKKEYKKKRRGKKNYLRETYKWFFLFSIIMHRPYFIWSDLSMSVCITHTSAYWAHASAVQSDTATVGFSHRPYQRRILHTYNGLIRNNLIKWGTRLRV